MITLVAMYPPKKSNEPTCEGLDLKAHDVFLNASKEKCISLANEMSTDPKHMITKGWPKQRHEYPDNLKGFWNYHDELSILDGLILKGTWIVIPEQCKDEIFDQLHEGHFGVDHTKMHARKSVYWPQINKDIEQLVKSCEICQEHSHTNQKDPSILREVPLTPWSTIESDLFMLDDHTFLLVVDLTSQFPIVRILSRENCTSVLNALKGMYCDFKLPKCIITDNGPCFKAVQL